MSILYNLKSGKNTKAFYFAKSVLRELMPGFIFRFRRNSLLKNVELRDDYDYIISRVDYYNKIDSRTELRKDAFPISKLKKGDAASTYFYDTSEVVRYFDSSRLISVDWGDVTYIPSTPSLVKSRPIVGNNRNSVVLKLDKIRHFIFVRDTLSWNEKLPIVYFRGKIPGKGKRERFFNRYFGDSLCDLGDSSRNGRPEWKVAKSTIKEHLRYRYILALEGNDVASNLKWVMSSNSVAVMPVPEFETWFMEGKLIPNYHYIAIKADFSDLQQRIAYYEQHPEEVAAIVKNAQEYTRQFRNLKREKIISLLTMQKYLDMTK